MKVENIMTKEPICCSPTDTVQTVAQLMKNQDIGAIPVVSDSVSKRLVGIVTDRDLCISVLAEGKDPRITKVEPYFTKTVVTCSPDDTVEVCEEKMKQNRVRRIPVVDKQNTCLGMVVQADLARSIPAEVFQKVVAEISTPRGKRPAAVSAA